MVVSHSLLDSQPLVGTLSPNFMILTFGTTSCPLGDLGYLLHKHPERLHTEDFAYGKG
jgi:hypothetical protein